ncbi:MAG: cation:proton antiporter subunit C, partial [Rhodospirillaceae bacterium]|nr:cation:proton antiporter subunit C [Rhodospirillaceae bacterium]
MELITGLFNYWVVVFLMMIGFYMVISHHNLVKKIVGLNIFQVSVFVFYISMSKIKGATAPILADGIEVYSNPLPHVLILTAIVVGVATTALGLALTVRIKDAFGSIEDDEIEAMEIEECVAEDVDAMIVGETRIVDHLNTAKRVGEIIKFIVHHLPQALRHSRIEIVRNDDFTLAVDLAPFVESPFGFETFLLDDSVVDSVGGRVVAKFF